MTMKLVVVVVCVLVMMKKEILMTMKHLVFRLVVHSTMIKFLQSILVNILKNDVFCYLLDGDDNRGDFDGAKKKFSCLRLLDGDNNGGDFDEYEEICCCCCCCMCDCGDKEGDFDDAETSCVSSGCTFNDNKSPKKNFDEYFKKLCFLLFTGC